MKNLLVMAAMLMMVADPAAAAGQFSLSAGFDYSSGKYGNTASTDILYIPVIGKYEADKVTLKLTVPYISVTGPGGVIRGLGRIGPPNNRAATTTHSGVGDIVASAGYTVYEIKDLRLDAVGSVKFGTANSGQGLGTGQNDYSAQIDGYYSFRQNTTFFATAGFRFYGAPPGADMGSAPYASIGASHLLSNVTTVGAMLDVAQGPSFAGSDRQEISAFVIQKMASKLDFQANVMRGLSDGSPDYGGGVLVTDHF
jgi:hypothetical protein